MDLGIIYTIWLREIKKFTREKPRIIGNLAMPFLWLGIMGVGLSATIASGGNYMAFITPGVIGMSLLFTSIFSGVSVIYDRQFGFLKEILVAPASRTDIVLGKVAGSATISILNGILVLILGMLFGGITIEMITPGGFLLALLFMALISAAFVSLGLVIAASMNSMEGFQVIMSLLVMPIFLLSGAFFPLDNVPPVMGIAAAIDPLMYGVDGLRGALIDVSRFAFYTDLGVLAAFSAAMIGLAASMFGKLK